MSGGDELHALGICISTDPVISLQRANHGSWRHTALFSTFEGLDQDRKVSAMVVGCIGYME